MWCQQKVVYVFTRLCVLVRVCKLELKCENKCQCQCGCVSLIRESERERPPCSGLVGSDQERRKLRCSRESKSCRVRLCELFRHCYWTKLFPKLTLKVLYQLDKVGEKKRLKRQHFLCPQARKLPLPLFSCTALFCLTRFQSWPCWSDLFSNCPWTSQPIMVFSLDRCW